MTYDNATTKALDHIVSKFPELGDIRATLTSANAITPAFVRAMRESDVPYGRRSLLVRVLLGDRSANRLVADSLSTHVLERLIDWLTFSGALQGNGAHREVVPKCVYTTLGLPPEDFHSLARLLARTWSEAATGATVSLPSLTHLAHDELRPLKRMVDAMRLSTATARHFIDSTPGHSPREGRWWFNTGIPALDLRNALVFSAVLLDGPLLAGRAQSRIPIALSERWRLNRVCLPDLFAFADVAALAIAGFSKLNPDSDWLGLAEAIAARHFLDDPEATDAIKAHLTRWILKEGDAVVTASDVRQKSGKYATGFLFNTRRLLSHKLFGRFAGYYESLDEYAFVPFAAQRWGVPSASIRKLNLVGINLRDIGNIMALLRDAGATDAESASRVLPPVARFALGAPEPKATGKGAPFVRSASERPESTRTFAMPLLETVLIALADARTAVRGTSHASDAGLALFNGDLPATPSPDDRALLLAQAWMNVVGRWDSGALALWLLRAIGPPNRLGKHGPTWALTLRDDWILILEINGMELDATMVNALAASNALSCLPLRPAPSPLTLESVRDDFKAFLAPTRFGDLYYTARGRS